MKLQEFRIGTEFLCSDRCWRCTDIGTRVVVAIRVDEVSCKTTRNGIMSSETLDGSAAEAAGWFNGPPYGVSEAVFDEYDQAGCEPVPEQGA